MRQLTCKSKLRRPPWVPRSVWEVCRRKEPLWSRESAEQRLNTLKRLPQTHDPERLQIYPCDEGLGPHFHVGHIKKERKVA